MQGISTKVTAATLATAVLTIVTWLIFDIFGVAEFPQPVLDAFELLAVFAAGYLVREKATVSDG